MSTTRIIYADACHASWSCTLSTLVARFLSCAAHLSIAEDNDPASIGQMLRNTRNDGCMPKESPSNQGESICRRASMARVFLARKLSCFHVFPFRFSTISLRPDAPARGASRSKPSSMPSAMGCVGTLSRRPAAQAFRDASLSILFPHQRRATVHDAPFGMQRSNDPSRQDLSGFDRRKEVAE